MTPHDIQNKRFERGMGGYKADEVHAYLNEISQYVQSVTDERDDIEKKMIVLAEKLEEYREDEDSLRSALIGAQKLADSVVREAKKKAEMILAEASEKANGIVSDARSNIDRESMELTRMQGEVAKFKSEILAMYREHIEIIQTIPGDELEYASVKKKAPPKKKPAEKKPDEPETFVLNYEDAEEEELDDIMADDSKNGRQRHKSFGDLRFGEEYNLTRND